MSTHVNLYTSDVCRAVTLGCWCNKMSRHIVLISMAFAVTRPEIGGLFVSGSSKQDWVRECTMIMVVALLSADD